MNTVEAVKLACKALDEHLAEDIRVINIGRITTISDYFIISNGKNENQMSAMQDAVEKILGKEGIHPKRVEGARTDSWILLDYGDFVIHIFSKEDREFYNLERIWADAPEVEYEEL